MRKTYKSLYRRYYEQPATEVFGFFPFNRDAGESWEHPFRELANMAKTEDWDFCRPEFRKANVEFPILHNYLNYTFLRLLQQDKIVYTSDGTGACLNTGLITPDEKEIFATFDKDRRSAQEDRFNDWRFQGFCDSYHKALNRFRSGQDLPKLATYIEDASDLVLNVNYNIEVNIAHILDDPDNHDRLPELLRDNRTLALAAVEGATLILKRKIARNYKTAIPQWYMPAGKIQLLLPLCLLQPERADLALVAEKDVGAEVYRVRTGLRMDMAYSNARLITRPDREWLNP